MVLMLSYVRNNGPQKAQCPNTREAMLTYWHRRLMDTKKWINSFEIDKIIKFFKLTKNN